MTWTFSKVVVCVSGSSTVIETETERTRHPLFLYFSSNLFQIKCFVVTTHLIVVWLVGWFEAVNSSYKDFLQHQWRELVEKFTSGGRPGPKVSLWSCVTFYWICLFPKKCWARVLIRTKLANKESLCVFITLKCTKYEIISLTSSFVLYSFLRFARITSTTQHFVTHEWFMQQQ